MCNEGERSETFLSSLSDSEPEEQAETELLDQKHDLRQREETSRNQYESSWTHKVPNRQGFKGAICKKCRLKGSGTRPQHTVLFTWS